jgi:hypothetical protein
MIALINKNHCFLTISITRCKMGPGGILRISIYQMYFIKNEPSRAPEDPSKDSSLSF